jgi:hypothetical protein
MHTSIYEVLVLEMEAFCSAVDNILLLFYPDVILGSRTLVISHAAIAIWDSRCKGKPLPGQHIQRTAMLKNVSVPEFWAS